MALSRAALGMAAALVGGSMSDLGGWPRYAIAALPIAIGIYVLGWIRLPMPKVTSQLGRSPVGALFAGVVLSLVFTPCGAPVLGPLLAYAAFGKSMVYGGILLFLYGFGTGLPILLASAAVARAARWLDASGWRKWVDRATGVVAISVGCYLVWKA
jgi:cytochrome c biogenesis protein CcdA